MAGKKFAAEFALRRNVSAQDKILIQDSDDDVVKYAYPPQIASLSGYAYAQSVADLPLLPTNKSIGYIVGQMLYIYVGMGGDTKDGLYQSVGFFVGPQGVQGEKGEKGERGEQGVQGPKGDNGGLSLQELGDYLATKQYVTGDTLADMLAGYVSNTSLMRDYVTIAKAQDVTGVKNFTAGVQFGGLPMYKSKDDTVYLDGNLVVRGAVTMYGMNTTTSPSIFSALPIDGTTIGRNERGELYVIGGTSGGGSGTGGGGVADSVAWSNVTNKPTWITDTKPKYSYSEILDTPDLSVYAIKSSVDNALSGKADKTTTLAGYGITNAYTKSEVNNIIDSLDDTYVTIAGEEQSITAEHNFVNGFKVGGLPIKKSQDKTLYLDANLVVSGAITMYGSDSTTFPTIWASIPFDSTMKWDGSKWSVVGSSGSGSGLDLVQLEEYLTTNGYATQSWVTGKGYITGITSAMVTNALGYTPYNSANFTKANIKSTLGISDWALASTKPTYTASEVGALASNGTASAAWKLANARYLWGQLFDGTSNVGGQILFNAGDFILAHNATDAWTDANGLTHPWYGIDFRVVGSYKGYISHWSGIALVSGNDITLSSQKNVIVNNGNFRIDQSAFNNGLILNRTAANAGAGIVFQSNGSLLGQIGINGTKTFEVSDGATIKAAIEIPTGNLLLAGAITMYYSSDERLKKNIRKVNASEVLMSLGGVWQYEYIDSEVQKNSVYDGTHFGLIYQNVKGKSLDKMCHKREDGMGALNYVDADFISIIAGATMENISEIEQVKRENRELRKELEQLKQRVHNGSINTNT